MAIRALADARPQRLTSTAARAESPPMSNATHIALIGGPMSGGDAPRRSYFRYWFSS